MFFSIKKKTQEIILQVTTQIQLNDERILLREEGLRRTAKRLSDMLDRKFEQDMVVYRNMIKSNLHVTDPDKARDMEQVLLLKAAELAARREGKAASRYDLRKFIETLIITSNCLD